MCTIYIRKKMESPVLLYQNSLSTQKNKNAESEHAFNFFWIFLNKWYIDITIVAIGNQMLCAVKFFCGQIWVSLFYGTINWIIANVSNDRAKVRDKLLNIVKEQYQQTPKFVVEMINLTGILKWNYQIQIHLENI